MARLIEQGRLFGQEISLRLAAVIRGEFKFAPGPKLTFEQGRERRYAVKQVATISHVYGISLDDARDVYCSAQKSHDAEGRLLGRVQEWVKSDRKAAKKALANQDLPESERAHHPAVLLGLCPELKKGLHNLKKQPYPSALRKLLDRLAHGPEG
ncbi:hypothetical protein [Frigidibacter sp. ROC022]|uniref:hypothetical protein n=1 Tax=Frigidibacter sp. ROC022 TaxID=2971796 RepID=UPI00215AF260|nr:hypothetical protein [Frigidibacter sp. ROC022]MCR8724978.1 hypothetical protein [Frigidibacter sp. ROC022]